MQLDRFSALKAVKDARLSGTSVKRLEDMSKECSVFASGARLSKLRDVRELSARLRCRKNLHFEGGNTVIDNKFEALPLRCGPTDWSLEFELPDPDLLIFVDVPRTCR
jgi:hypothetical protein